MRFKIIIALLASSVVLFGQSPYILPGTITDEIGDRWDILYDFDHNVFASQRNISRQEISQRAFQILNEPRLSNAEKWDVHYILKDNNEYSIPWSQESGDLDSTSREKVYDSTGVFYYLEDGNIANKSIQIGQRREPVFGYFYKSEANLFEINQENF